MKSGPIKPVRRDMPPEHAAILRAVAAIPRGRIMSYGEVATRAGLPRRARLVGRVLRDAPADLDLPWHRVMRAGGRIAFPPRTRGYREQVRRLAAEGVTVVRGRADPQRYGADRDLDAILWGPPRPHAATRVTKREKT